jgi:hypothetical protein
MADPAAAAPRKIDSKPDPAADVESKVDVKNLLGGTSIVGATGLAFSYAVLSGFFGAFGLTPEQVGLATPYSLIRMSLGGALIILVGPLVLWPVLAQIYRRARFEQVPADWTYFSRKSSRRMRALYWAPLLLTSAAYFVYEGILSTTYNTDFGYKPAVPAVVGGVAIYLSLRQKPDSLTEARLTSVFSAAVLVAASAITLNFVANQMGQELRVGVRNAATILMGQTPPIAEIAEDGVSYRVLLLGRGNDGWVIYDCSRKAVLFKDPTQVQVTVLPMIYKSTDADQMRRQLNCA